ncbi:unnamed protein product, partial [Trichobilharzia regenti]
MYYVSLHFIFSPLVCTASICSDFLNNPFENIGLFIEINMVEYVQVFVECSCGSLMDPSLHFHCGLWPYSENILCCEGNGGYPEIGTPVVPLEQGYSVLGWNHPGFGESTGLPFPEKEQNAVEACFLFAVHRLNFKPAQIYLFGWSIGGYTASWTAMNFPNVAGLVSWLLMSMSLEVFSEEHLKSAHFILCIYNCP